MDSIEKSIKVNRIVNKIDMELQLGNTTLLGEVFEKGKRAQLGEIREWKGKKFQKTGQGWVPVKESRVGKREKPAVLSDNDALRFEFNRRIEKDPSHKNLSNVAREMVDNNISILKDKGGKRLLYAISDDSGKISYSYKGEDWVDAAPESTDREDMKQLTAAEQVELDELRYILAYFDSKIKDLSGIKLSRTTEGDWRASRDGKNLGILRDTAISGRLALKAGLIEEDEREVEELREIGRENLIHQGKSKSYTDMYMKTIGNFTKKDLESVSKKIGFIKDFEKQFEEILSSDKEMQDKIGGIKDALILIEEQK